MLFSLLIRRCYKLLGFGILRFHTRFRFFSSKNNNNYPLSLAYCNDKILFLRIKKIILNGIHWSTQIRSKLKHVSVGEISVCGEPNLINQLL